MGVVSTSVVCFSSRPAGMVTSTVSGLTVILAIFRLPGSLPMICGLMARFFSTISARVSLSCWGELSSRVTPLGRLRFSLVMMIVCVPRVMRDRSILTLGGLAARVSMSDLGPVRCSLTSSSLSPTRARSSAGEV